MQLPADNKMRSRRDRKKNGPPNIASMDWQVVPKRRQKPSRPRRARPDLIIVKAKEGGPSYADMLRVMKGDPTLKSVGDSVTKVRRNAAGNLLLELEKSAKATEVSAALLRKLGESASVVTRTDEAVIEIRDLDELTTADDVRAALGKELETNVGEEAMKSIRKAYGNTQTAVVRLPLELARKAVENGRLRIGWVNCRVREKLDVRKCYRCWAFGHLARNCRGTDRSKCCLRCGEAGHFREACKSVEAKCVLCTDKRSHPTGSFGCPVYQAATKTAAGRKWK